MSRAVVHYLASVVLAVAAACTMSGGAHAATGLDELPNMSPDDGPVTVFYPTAAEATPYNRGPLKFQFARRAEPQRGNGHLIVFSHGSGGSPWVHAHMAEKLVQAGFIVAVPEHRNDNWRNLSEAGPVSWQRRPHEVSHAIDTVTQSARFAGLLQPNGVGVWGMSAGGHTALVLAGGQWSRANLLRHCQRELDDDFAACTGPSTELTGGWGDGLKKSIVRGVVAWKLDDEARQGHTDPRIAAIVSEVPYAADFDFTTFAQPKVPLGIVQARGDVWLPIRFHSQKVLEACKPCERLADEPTAGHGSFMSPAAPGLEGYMLKLLGDPPGLDREKVVPVVHARIVDFFQRHLLKN